MRFILVILSFPMSLAPPEQDGASAGDCPEVCPAGYDPRCATNADANQREFGNSFLYEKDICQGNEYVDVVLGNVHKRPRYNSKYCYSNVHEVDYYRHYERVLRYKASIAHGGSVL